MLSPSLKRRAKRRERCETPTFRPVAIPGSQERREIGDRQPAVGYRRVGASRSDGSGAGHRIWQLSGASGRKKPSWPGPLMSEPMGFVIEDRGGVSVVVFDSGGCRPASDVELDLWASLAAAEAELETLRGRLAHIRPLTDAEWQTIQREHDVVFEARKLAQSVGEINSTKSLNAAIARYDEARHASSSPEYPNADEFMSEAADTVNPVTAALSSDGSEAETG